MSQSDAKSIAVVVPSRGTTMQVTITAVTTLPELLHVAQCPDWYVASSTRRGPAISLINRRLIDAVHNKGRLYLSPPVTTHQQMSLPLQADTSRQSTASWPTSETRQRNVTDMMPTLKQERR